MDLKGYRLAIAILLGAMAYYGAARAGYAIAFVHGTVSAVWPPTGVALALVWLGGPRMLPAVFLGELTGDLTNGSPLILSLAFACGSAGEALAGYGLLRATRFRAELDRVRDVFALLLLCALVSTAVSASVGTLALLAHGDISGGDVWSTWHVWWLGDATGDVVIAPLLLVLARTWRPPSRPQLIEAIAFLATLAGLVVIARQLTLGIAYLVLPVLIWAALRFRQQGAVIANAVLAGAGVVGASQAASEIARVSVLERILFTQNFVTVGAITTLVLAAVIAERDTVSWSLRRTERTARALAAERSALGLIATAVAREQDRDEVLALVARQAVELLGAAWAEVTHNVSGAGERVAAWPDAGRTVSEPQSRSLSAAITAAGGPWGTLTVHGAPAAARERDEPAVVERLAELAGLAVTSSAHRAALMVEASTDSLTGLLNPRAFQRRLAAEVTRARRYGRPLSLVMVDLDGFKAVNDAEGHQAGDRVLAEVAARMVSAVRLDAVTARIGGDELAVLLPECDAETGYSVAERICAAVAVDPLPAKGRITVSAGAAGLGPGDVEELIRAADAALYAAKRMGGNSAARYTDGLQASAAAPDAAVTARSV